MALMIADTGCANLASVRFAFARLGVEAKISADPDELKTADRLVLPGVGSAGAGMAALRAKGLDEMLQDFARPLLGICLGMQLLFKTSIEDDVRGLGLLGGRVEALPDTAGPVPHMGWNTLSLRISDPILRDVAENSYVYFVHSYGVKPDENTLAITQYGMEFSAIVRRDNIYGCQFHPERSGATGAQILQNFLDVNP
jgi:imidazole glycerol-phosphate synthase subunit HisH